MNDKTLCLMPSGLPEIVNKPWKLVLRSHDLGGTNYETIALWNDEIAREVMEAGTISWLFGTPDWNDRYKKRQLEKARIMKEEAAKLEQANS